jgi:GT2 family glycosyltransferase
MHELAGIERGLRADDDVGVVVIGRNEGRRLEECLAGLVGVAQVLVYVDSGSTDESAHRARSLGVETIELTSDKPFTAARGRNEGARRLAAAHPHVNYVQFVDGDCVVHPDWLHAAREYLAAHGDVAAVTGRLQEERPAASCYNRLAQMEWDEPAGEVDQCGGIAMMRLAAWSAVGGFREVQGEGEEPELCWRLRAAGWRIVRTENPMARHDADMQHFGQWWRRCVRGGRAARRNWQITGIGGGRPSRRMALRALTLGLAFPVGAGTAIAISLARGRTQAAWICAACAVALAGVQIVRVARNRKRRGAGAKDALLFAMFNTLGKIPEAIGVCQASVSRTE